MSDPLSACYLHYLISRLFEIKPFNMNLFSKRILGISMFVLTTGSIVPWGSFEAEASVSQNEEKHTKNRTEGYRKTGWSIAPLPAISYGSNLGAQLGAVVDAYYFGNGDTYPEYLHKITAEVAYFTKGSGIYHIFYDSKYLLHNLRITASASYLPNRMMDFYGFNGYASPYDENQGRSFYAIDRNLLRVMTDLQGRFHDKRFGWAAGIVFYNYNTGKVKLEKYKDAPSLYQLYVDNGVIFPDESQGGTHLEFKTAAFYDTRDHEPDPTRGIYTNAILYGSPDFINGRGYSYLKLAAAFRHYLTLIDRHRLVFAYHIAYQGTLAGKTPFYIQQNMTTLFLRQINSDLLGGSASLRGVLYNRVVGDGEAWFNAEFRIRLIDFLFIKQEWYITTNPFFDTGMVVQPFRLAEMKRSGLAEIYNGASERLHSSIGIGLKVVMNQNFVISFEYGKPFDKRDGNGGMYLGLNYIF